MNPGVKTHKFSINAMSDNRVPTPLCRHFYTGITRVTLRKWGHPQAQAWAITGVQAHIRCHSSGFIKKKSFTGILATAIFRLQASGLFDMKSKP
jgi:hypothetical protein